MSTGFGSRGGLWGASLATACFIAGAGARAQPSELVLDWQAPDECPASADVRAWVDELLGEADVASPVVARGVLRSQSGGHTLELELMQGDSWRQRVLQHDSCQELGRAGALVFALALAPEISTGAAGARFPDLRDLQEPAPSEVGAKSERAPAVRARASEVEPEPEPVAPGQSAGSQPSSHPTAGTSGPRRVFVQLATVGNAGALPRFSPGLGFGLGAHLGARRTLLAAVELDGYAPRSTFADENHNAGGDFQLFTAAASICLRLLANGGEPVHLLGCALAEVNRMSGRGFGGDEWNGEGVGYWFAPGGAVEAGLSEGEVQIGIRLGVSAPIHPPSYVIENSGPVHTPGRLVGLLAVVGRWSIL